MNSEIANLGHSAKYVDSATAADLLGVSLSTLHRWTREGKIAPAIQGRGIRGAKFYDRSTIDDLISDAKPKVSL